MNQAAEDHTTAMELASRAELALREGNQSTAQALFHEAFVKEKQAALAVPHSLEPTRSVLIRSAASLAIECGELREAEQLIGVGLASNGPEEILEEIRDLYENLTFSRHLRLQGVELKGPEIHLSLSGNAVAHGLIAADEYVPRVQLLDSVFVRISERKREIPFREKGKPSRAAQQGTSVFLSAATAASFAVTIRLGGAIHQQDLLHPISEVIDDFLDCVKLFGSERWSDLYEHIGDVAYYRHFVHQLWKIAPDGERIRTIWIASTNRLDGSIALRGRPTPDYWRVDQSRETVKVIGVLTEAAKKTRTNKIGIRKESGEVVTVEVPKGMMAEIVRPLWDRRVSVVAIKKGLRILLDSITPLEDVD
jgi:hypothetical protein